MARVLCRGTAGLLWTAAALGVTIQGWWSSEKFSGVLRGPPETDSARYLMRPAPGGRIFCLPGGLTGGGGWCGLRPWLVGCGGGRWWVLQGAPGVRGSSAAWGIRR
jgi:hypothetical protein